MISICKGNLGPKWQSSNGDLGYGKMDLGLQKTKVSERK